MWAALQFLIVAFRCYRNAGKQGVGYGVIQFQGVPNLAICVATGREAWRASMLAIRVEV
jgi:hypothetical protein